MKDGAREQIMNIWGGFWIVNVYYPSCFIHYNLKETFEIIFEIIATVEPTNYYGYSY